MQIQIIRRNKATQFLILLCFLHVRYASTQTPVRDVKPVAKQDSRTDDSFAPTRVRGNSTTKRPLPMAGASSLGVTVKPLVAITRPPLATTKLPPTTKKNPASTAKPALVTTTRPTTTKSTTPTTKSNSIVCGTSSKVNTRIVGGQPADQDEWPWIAALLRDKDDNFCGGTLITNQHILTAAHCVYRQKENEIRVRLGEYDFKKISKKEKDYTVKKIHIHENYDRKTQHNDIALIKLTQRVTFDSTKSPVCLPPNTVALDGQITYVTGWGTTSFAGKTSSVLMEVFIPVWNQTQCKAAYPKLTISATQLCAGYKQGGRDSCQGDSGGPMVYQTSTGKWIIVGIVSYGIGCALPGKPGVYTRVTSHLPWIKDKVFEDSLNKKKK